jgi:hypothetical protein
MTLTFRLILHWIRLIVSSIEYIVKKTKEKKVGAYCIRPDSVERIELVS